MTIVAPTIDCLAALASDLSNYPLEKSFTTFLVHLLRKEAAAGVNIICR
jgi:hypothetical protein